MDLKLKYKAAIVAGGSRGCGFAISGALAAEGAKVVITGREAEHVNKAVEQIRADGGTASGVVADMSNASGAKRIVDEAHAAFGPISVLVVNPRSASQTRGFEALTDEELDDAHQTWVMSIARLARGVLPDMKAAQWGRILCIGSIGMKVLHLEDPMYAQNLRVAAAALIKTLSHEYGTFGITANTIATGPFMSEVARRYMETGGLSAETMLAKTASGRWGDPKEMGAVAAFLCSDQASFITGETIRVDSGYTHSLF
ncbi:SDR family NAD(P)-dependent oxidoreductase [Novosphingobium taihuense]|uniref:NAD(P)-dependent dehydrogenase (Short-subunit alcohol dehydrogenase family) n=1 Tax=Novosphingobium taihuense TaxID=260085 RepID=A0A7W7EUR9_9SPHN|nr:SDR family oxidoreductase [Novosphingobium taihuense]MBB4614236.1 NAD(P)-dependent dehydrogenase (short-subunit alcohol dehydrogenase family) [Novosphingobium taihuense]TWH87083.1 3-oxoacyl-[acyl-carrier protein] reductase [Novosphingobium taihuense]